MATEINKEFVDVYSHSAPSYCTVVKWVSEFNDPTRAFEDAARRSGRPTTVLTEKSVRAVHKRS